MQPFLICHALNIFVKNQQFLKSPAKNIFFKVFIKKTSYLCHPYFGIVAQALSFSRDLH